MNGQPYTGANTMLSPPIVTDFSGLRAWSSNVRGAFADLLEDPLRVEPHPVLLLDDLTGVAQHLDRLREQELDAELGDDPSPPSVERGHRVLAEDLVARHGVGEQPGPP